VVDSAAVKPRLSSLAIVLALAVAAPSRDARADAGEAEQRAAAQALFDAAVKLTRDKRWDEACPKLEEVVRLQPSAVGAKLELAECYAQTGRLASAWSSFSAAESAARAQAQLPRAQKAHEQADALKPRLSDLAVEVPAELRGLDGLEVRRDGVVIGPGQWAVPVPVDGGRHVVTAKAAGRAPFQANADVPPEKGHVVVTVALALAPVEAAPPAALAVAATPVAAPSPAPASQARDIPTWPWIVGGVGVALLAVGVGFGVDGLAAKSELTRACGAELVCPPGFTDMDALTARKNRGLGLFVGLGAAGVFGISSAIVGIATAPPKSRLSAKGGLPSLRVAPAPLDRGAGVALGGAF
jgi:hypothetical protein